MQVVDVQPVLHGVQADVVGGADGAAAANASAGDPHGEAVGVVVAAVPLFAHGRAAEFAPPDDERVVEEAAPLQIFE